MTTRKAKSGKPAAAAADDAARVRRPMPARTGPIRSDAARPSAPPAPPPHDDVPISESIAHTVRLGYDVVAENIKQGRLAAERFRHGEYNIRDVPGDVEVLAKRMIDLARDLTTTTFDVVERLLKDAHVGDRAPKAPKAPAFRATPGSAAPKRPQAAKSAPAAGPELPVKCVFTGKRKAVVRSALLSRPTVPVLPESGLSVDALKATKGAAAITGVTFAADGAGLRITIPIAADLPAGTYSGMVCAEGSPWALGVLAIEVLQ
jgi:hypothetical protein